MLKLFLMIAVVLPAGVPDGYARGIHDRSGGLTAPANPSVPPSLTPNSRLTGSAPLPPHQQPTRADAASRGISLAPDPEESKVDREIKGICRGC